MAINIVTMLLRCTLLLWCFAFVQPTKYVSENVNRDRASEYSDRFSFWPSMHNAASAHFLRNRRDVLDQKVSKPSGEVVAEGGGVPVPQPPAQTKPALAVSSEGNKIQISTDKNVTELKPEKLSNETIPGNSTDNTTAPIPPPQNVSNGTTTAKISSDTEKPPAKDIDLNNPDVLKRGFIVFGGFALLAIAYFVFYKRKSTKTNTSNNNSNANDTNQFRYGVLQSEDRRDNMELSRVPLTMESEDDDEDDLEIFDLEQKKKSLSYVNLPMNDEDVVLSLSNERDDRDNLLLDIESQNSEMLINWSSNSNNKSIL